MGQFLKDMQVGGAERFIEQYSSNEQQINAENRLLSQGQLLQINSYDDNDAHVSGHEEFQKSARYRGLDDSAKRAFEQHTQDHRQMLQNTMQLAQPPLPGLGPAQLPPGPQQGGQNGN
jgi:hypothetical protein